MEPTDSSPATQPITIDTVLDAWFADADTGKRDQPQIERWFSGGATLDKQLRETFGDALDAAASGELDAWQSSAEGTLALVIMLDQFSRNIHRGTARAFAYDPRALEIASVGIKAGFDKQLPVMQRIFLYMPFEHDETPESQACALQFFGDVLDTAPEEMRDFARETLKAAEDHAAIIAQFGRYPHRNAVLRRESTPEEAKWLADGAKRFGQ